MAHPLHHAQSSARKYGGKAEDYLAIHSWFDESKQMMADFRHRALRHHAEGIFMAERLFGVSIKNSDGKEIPVRFIGEQHVREDLGFIPSMQDWFCNIQSKPWMSMAARHGPKGEETPKQEAVIDKAFFAQLEPIHVGA